MHKSTKHILQFFAYQHLHPHLQEVSKPFSELANHIAAGPQNPETTVALRWLLQAKDAAVRAFLVPEELVVPTGGEDNERSCYTCASRGCPPIRVRRACSDWMAALADTEDPT